MNLLKRYAMAWTYAEVNGVRIHIPFDENIPEYGPNHFQLAKGTRDQILSFTEATCNRTDAAGIQDWMNGDNETDLKVGIDCSGFVYRLLDEALAAAGAPRLEATLGRDAYHTSAEMLTDLSDPTVVTPIHRAQDVRPGDILRCHGGGHVAAVIEVLTDPDGNVTEVWYAHSGFSGGPHISWIEVQEPEASLLDASTQWHEAAEDPELRDNHFRDEYLDTPVRTHYYRGDRSLVVKAPVTVTCNDTRVAFPLAPFVREGISFAPIRALAGATGAQVDWDGVTQRVTLWRGNRWMAFRIGSTRADTSNGSLTLAAPPELVLDNTVVPIRGLAEGLGLTVHWLGDSATVALQG